MSDAAEIPLSRGMVALVDPADAALVSPFKWYANPAGRGLFYARRDVVIAGERFAVLMHRFLTGAPPDMEVDHANGNGLDNRRSSNLRVCTVAQNRRARRRQWDNQAGQRGVWEEWGRFRACIWLDGRTVHLGSFDTLDQASAVYRAAALKAWGEFYVDRPAIMPPENPPE